MSLDNPSLWMPGPGPVSEALQIQWHPEVICPKFPTEFEKISQKTTENRQKKTEDN